MAFNQARNVKLLKDSVALLDRMETPEDQVKFYYYLLPTSYVGYTANITVRVNKPGWLPNLYV